MQLSNRKKNLVSDKKKYIIFSELNSLLTAGLSFSSSFEMLINGENKKNVVLILENVFLHIINGMEIWKAMEASKGFSSLDTGVIRIGEETGKLSQSLQFLSDYYKKKNEQRSILISALSYPIVIVVTAVFVLFFMITVVIPMFEQVYSRMGGTLPEMTQFMMNLSAKFPMFCVTCIFIGIGFIVIRLLWGETDEYKKITSEMLLRIPLIGNLIKTHYQAQFCKLLYLLISSDVQLTVSLDMLKDIISFYPYSQSFKIISEGLKQGDTFSENLDKFKNIYGHKLTALIHVGEETNCMDKMFSNLYNDITQELEHKLKRLGSILEPILILCIGTIVGFVLIAMYLPMFKLGQTIN